MIDAIALDALLSHARSFVSHPLFTYPVAEIHTDTLSVWWGVLDHVGRMIDARKDAIRDRLQREVAQVGQQTTKGRKQTFPIGTLYRLVSGGKDFEPVRTIDLLTSKGLPLKGILTPKKQRVAYVVNPSAVHELVELGALTESEAEQLREEETVTLRVAESAAFLDAVEAVLPRLPGQPRKGGATTEG